MIQIWLVCVELINVPADGLQSEIDVTLTTMNGAKAGVCNNLYNYNNFVSLIYIYGYNNYVVLFFRYWIRFFSGPTNCYISCISRQW